MRSDWCGEYIIGAVMDGYCGYLEAVVVFSWLTNLVGL